MQIVTSWMRQGLEQGRVEGKLELAQKQLSRRFGPLSEQEEIRLKELDAAQLEMLGEEFLDFKERAHLDAWLETHATTPTAG